MGQHGVLHHVPVVGRKHILRALVENGVQGVAGNIECHGVGTGVEVHLVQVFKIVDVRQNTAGGGVVLQVVDHPVNLIEHALLVLVLDAQLVAVSLADGAVLPHPFVPDVAAQICDTVGLFLPYPEKLVHGAFPIGAPQGHNGEFLG